MHDHQLLMCEFHDARVESIEVRSVGDCVITFESLNCFLPVDGRPDLADVWAARASLSIRGSSEVELSHLSTSELWVSDGTFEFPSGEPQDKFNLSLLQGRQLVTATFVFTNGGKLKVTGGHALLKLTSMGKKFEQCDWP